MDTPFEPRHIGPRPHDTQHMLDALGYATLDDLIDAAVPEAIRSRTPLNVPAGLSEADALKEIRSIMAGNQPGKSLIGQGYTGTHVPPVIARNLLENPAWYTSYTPYQAEIAQGRLELLFHFQTLAAELAGLDVANASLLDESTALAEAVGMAQRHHRGKRSTVLIASDLHPQHMGVLHTRTRTVGVNIQPYADENLTDDVAAVVLQTPDTHGELHAIAELADKAHAAGALLIVVSDPLHLTLVRPPGHDGADIVLGSMQRFGVPMGNGGPHAAFLAAPERMARLLPGRLVGESVDAQGRVAYRLALQTREQHIRREKATSNICTAQALLANMAAAYAVYHGPEGLAQIANRVRDLAGRFAVGARNAGLHVVNDQVFDTVTVDLADRAGAVLAQATAEGLLLRDAGNGRVGVAFDETTQETDLQAVANVFGFTPADTAPEPTTATRDMTRFLTQPVFHENRSETAMMRFLRRLADKDLALDRAMIPLGSCTMKLNAAAEMMPLSWTETSDVHPYAPAANRAGYERLAGDLRAWLADVTGFADVSFQPNAGSQGEFAGLIAIRRYHEARGEGHRDVCLIPSSAHGTNPASAQMAGYEVVVVGCTDRGDIDLEDLHAKAEAHKDRLAAMMVTYPSTHGVFEEGIKDACEIVHDRGGQVYVDGANLNALVGLARVGEIGGDVCHMNLHKTFAIPHGGGGPGVGPIGVAAHLAPFVPGRPDDEDGWAVSAAPEGSASILTISWMYVRMLGGAGLTAASKHAILAANYLAHRLKDHYPILYTGANGLIAHECILDTRVLKDLGGVSVDDIAKRLIDYGFHAPTMSWPVVGTMMIEPTESEPLAELDRFADAMIGIREEAERVITGVMPADDNPLVNAPHTAEDLAATDWPHPYTRHEAVFPAGVTPASKIWPPVGRVDNVHGDRNLVCTCAPVEAYDQ